MEKLNCHLHKISILKQQLIQMDMYHFNVPSNQDNLHQTSES